MKLLHVWVDSREVKPLRFPASVRIGQRTYQIKTTVRRMETADYCNAEHPTDILVERKNGVEEIGGNLLIPAKLKNFEKQLVRMRDGCSRPFLAYECNPNAFLKPVRLRNGKETHGRVILQRLFEACLDHGVSPVALPYSGASAKLHAGEFVARLLLASPIIR